MLALRRIDSKDVFAFPEKAFAGFDREDGCALLPQRVGQHRGKIALIRKNDPGTGERFRFRGTCQASLPQWKKEPVLDSRIFSRGLMARRSRKRLISRRKPIALSFKWIGRAWNRVAGAAKKFLRIKPAASQP